MDLFLDLFLVLLLHTISASSQPYYYDGPPPPPPLPRREFDRPHYGFDRQPPPRYYERQAPPSPPPQPTQAPADISKIETATRGSLPDQINILMNGGGIRATENPFPTTTSGSIYQTLPDHIEYEEEQKKLEEKEKKRPKPNVRIEMKAGRDGPIAQVLVKERPQDREVLLTEFPIQLQSQDFDANQEWNRILKKNGPQTTFVQGDSDGYPAKDHDRPEQPRSNRLQPQPQPVPRRYGRDRDENFNDLN